MGVVLVYVMCMCVFVCLTVGPSSKTGAGE